MQIQHQPINFEDERGTIRDILVNIPNEHITVIHSKPGIVRGNHYHRHTTQYTYVLSGEGKYYSALGTDEASVAEIKEGDFIMSPPLEHHAIKAITDLVMLAIAHGPRGGKNYESDTYRERTLAE